MDGSGRQQWYQREQQLRLGVSNIISVTYIDVLYDLYASLILTLFVFLYFFLQKDRLINTVD